MHIEKADYPETPYKFEPYKHKINGTIANAIGRYECNRVALRQLLSDYNDVITYPEYLEKAINPWEYLSKGIKKQSVVCGVSVVETLFNISAMSLYKQKPIDVIKSIYYKRKENNDSGLEYYFLHRYGKEFIKYKRPLIVNPSPVMIEYFEKIGNAGHYVVTDETLAQLYSKQYKKAAFESFDHIGEAYDADVMILFMSNMEENQIQDMMRFINLYKAKKIYGIIQMRLIDNKKSSFWKSITDGELNIREIVIVPNTMSNSSPKKKGMIYLERTEEKKEIEIQRVDFKEDTKLIIPSEDKVIADKKELVKYNTVNAVWKQAILEEKSGGQKTGVEYSAADLYPFTKEIYLSYAIYPQKEEVYGKAYYAETANTQIPSIRGKSLTARTSRGLHGKTEEIVMGKMEEFAYIPQVSDAIQSDITTHYLEPNIPVSMKTLWFCLRNDLQKNNSYDDSFMKELFTNNKKLAALSLSKSNTKTIQETIEELIELGEEKKELQILKMLNLMVIEAIKQGYLSENRILPLLPAAQNRASKRQAQVRQALAKRSFEEIEEQKIVNYLKPFYVEHSNYLAVMIRLMTGISSKETSALLWRNFQYNKGTGIYTLSITKFVDNRGKWVSHALEESWEKYRILPISMLLGKILERRKRFLMRKGLKEEILENYPIVIARENLDQMLKGRREEFCKPAVIAQKCRESISKAEIAQHMLILPDEENGTEMETDINSYGGDIFKTNFREKALNVAGFSLDEVNVYLGIKKPDTFSQNYCDYTNDYVLLIMAKKLNRWQNKYLSKLFAFREKETEEIRGEIEIDGVHDGVSGIILEVRNPGKKTKIEVLGDPGYTTISSPCKL